MLNHFYAQVLPTQPLCLLASKKRLFGHPQKEIFAWRGGLISDSFGIGLREDSNGSYSFFEPSLTVELMMMMMMVMNYDDDDDWGGDGGSLAHEWFLLFFEALLGTGDPPRVISHRSFRHRVLFQTRKFPKNIHMNSSTTLTHII